MTPRFFSSALPDAILSADAPAAAAGPDLTCTLGPDETRHARKVLRLSEGDRVEVFDGTGRLAVAELVAFTKTRAGLTTACRVCETWVAPETVPRIRVASALPKGPRAEAMVNQLGQLGADVLLPVRCERGVVEPGGGKIERFEKASLASAKQSGRPRPMRVEPMADLADVVGRARGLKLLLDPRGETMPGLAATLSSAAEVSLLVGPEGGWAESEIEAAREAGFVSWRINANVLRIETAAAAAVSVLRCLTLE